MATIAASHYLYLTRDQRYSLTEGKTIKCDGVYLPVWHDEGKTNEPAAEVFCVYTVRNSRRNASVEKVKQGFVIDMPFFDTIQTNESAEPIAAPDKETIKAAQRRLGTAELLLDLDDGGDECAEFSFFHKLTIGKNQHNVIHFVEIKPIELLLDTIG